MKTRDFLEKNPVATEIIKKYYVKVLEDSLATTDNVPENFREYLQERSITMDEVVAMVDGNPRVLVDVFDENEIYGCLDMKFDGGKPVFGVNIDGAISEVKFANRKDAEQYMIFECITFLNNKTN